MPEMRQKTWISSFRLKLRGKSHSFHVFAKFRKLEGSKEEFIVTLSHRDGIWQYLGSLSDLRPDTYAKKAQEHYKHLGKALKEQDASGMFMYQLSARGDDDDDYADDSDGDGGSSTPSAPLGMSAIGELRLNISKYLKEQGVKILLASISLTKDPQKLKLRSRSRSKQWTDVEVERELRYRMTHDLTAHLMTESKSRELVQRENRSLKNQVDEQKQLNTSLVAINHNMEEDLLDQFVTIINTKKQKIIDTENQLEKMMIEHKELRVQSSRTKVALESEIAKLQKKTARGRRRRRSSDDSDNGDSSDSCDTDSSDSGTSHSGSSGDGSGSDSDRERRRENSGDKRKSGSGHAVGDQGDQGRDGDARREGRLRMPQEGDADGERASGENTVDECANGKANDGRNSQGDGAEMQDGVRVRKRTRRRGVQRNRALQKSSSFGQLSPSHTASSASPALASTSTADMAPRSKRLKLKHVHPGASAVSTAYDDDNESVIDQEKGTDRAQAHHHDHASANGDDRSRSTLARGISGGSTNSSMVFERLK